MNDQTEQPLSTEALPQTVYVTENLHKLTLRKPFTVSVPNRRSNFNLVLSSRLQSVGYIKAGPIPREVLHQASLGGSISQLAGYGSTVHRFTGYSARVPRIMKRVNCDVSIGESFAKKKIGINSPASSPKVRTDFRSHRRNR